MSLDNLKHQEASKNQFSESEVFKGKTIGHIARELKVSTRWLESNLRNLTHTATFTIDKKTGIGTKEDSYSWGEPRIGDKYEIKLWNGVHNLYRIREGKTIFMEVPFDKLLGEKVAILEETHSHLDDLKNSFQINTYSA